MKKLIAILQNYLVTRIPRESIILSFILAAIATSLQYSLGLKQAWLNEASGAYLLLYAMLFYGIPLVIFLAIWGVIKKEELKVSPAFIGLLLLTVFAFALRVGFNAHSTWVYHTFENWDYGIRLTNTVILGPIMCSLPIVWWFFMDRKSEKRVYGLSIQGVSWKAYFLLLLMMVPLIALASTQKDFIHYYPKVARLFSEEFPWNLKQAGIYELFYGIDFVYIEFFFRGFLVIAFSRFLGPTSIPFAALMYCTIHFGKPLGETISSWFGGMILGILVYETRSIAGGVVVHMGIAWLMELGGSIGRLFEK